MLNLEQFMNMHLLRKEGHSIRDISRLSGHSRNTVRKILRQRTPQPASKRIRSGKILDPYVDYLRRRFFEHQLSAVRLSQELAQMGYRGSVDTVRKFVRQLKRQAGYGCPKLTVRYETPPGKQAQCDWAEVGRYDLRDGRRIYVHAFVMLLSYSRYLYAHFTVSMRREVLIDCHHRAFEFFGGIPETILYDNLKTVMNSPLEVNPEFADFALYYGIGVKNHRPYRPRTKGKVERAVRYLKDNFLRGRSFAGLEDLNAQLKRWLELANARVHATTGRIPAQALTEERLMAFDPSRLWSPVSRVRRRVSAEALVQHGGSFYSVPASFCGRSVRVEARATEIKIQCEDVVIASHTPAKEAGSRIELAEHVRQRWDESVHCPSRRAGVQNAAALCQIDFDEGQQVQQRALSEYEQEVAA